MPQELSKLKEDNDSQYKRGQKEVASKLEAKLKERYDIESELTGVELVEHILTNEIEKVKGKGEDITANPEYLKLKLENDKALKAKDKEWQKKLEERESEFKRESVFTRVKDKSFCRT